MISEEILNKPIMTMTGREFLELFGKAINTPAMKKITCKRDFKNHSFKADDAAAHRLVTDYSVLLQAEKFGQSLKPIIDMHEMMMIKLHRIACKYNLNIWECLKTAYNVIKNRTGKMINGVFIRDEK